MSKLKKVAPWSRAGYVKMSIKRFSLTVRSNGNGKCAIPQFFWDELLNERGSLSKKNDGLQRVTTPSQEVPEDCSGSFGSWLIAFLL